MGLLRCFPDIAGKLATAGQLSLESTQEQRSAGVNKLTSDEKSKLDLLNARKGFI